MKPMPSSSAFRPSARSLFVASCCAAMSQRMTVARLLAARRRGPPLVFVALRPSARGLHEHGRRHAVGADVDLDVLVGGAERDPRLDERAARAETERRA